MQYKNNTSTYLFYDYETFGKHTALDKPAQFACVRTDMEFNIIDTPQCFYCIPSDDYLPDPSAVLMTYITPQYAHQHGINECLFAKRIYNIFNIPNTCIIGYNNIHFDDEITRNIFYRNFFDSYEWSWKNSNSRWDVLHLLKACYAFRPNSIKWLKNTLGRISFKLSDITKANNIIHENVHDAISDVYATIAITKLVKEKEPKLFNFFFKMRKKHELQKLIDFKAFKPIVYVSNYFSITNYYLSIILPITYCKNNKNTLIAIDLLKDTQKIINFFKQQSINNDSCIKDLFNLGIVSLNLNRCPILAPIQTMRIEDYHRLNINASVYKKNIHLIKKNNFYVLNVTKIFFKQNNIIKSHNVDLQIYDAFFNFHDKKLIEIIRNTKAIFLKNINYHFYDNRLQTLLFRYRARNFFYTLNQHEKTIWLKHCTEMFNLIYLEKYHNQIAFLFQENSHNFKNIILLQKLLNYSIQKRKRLLYETINLN
ncbi:exodeoxyribonuclease I [Buchnera aphidicola]|uniref:Exodeoxyribonuclease I n=1 Tax=Buchnera aphidicola subsp. Uroleucon sonchi TaxID=118118 RepID=A0A6C1FBB9_BUCUN|nr:exodeoxyribonuclease I [Buchnera aphidicola]QIE02228.1 exodeoxyribonuclease I [Buchnera aphidicola (Uroleucon sonchi)]